jgi:hypothetical protein
VLTHFRAGLPRQRHRRVAAVGIHHEDVIRPAQALDAICDVARFVQRQDDGGELGLFHGFQYLIVKGRGIGRQ